MALALCVLIWHTFTPRSGSVEEQKLNRKARAQREHKYELEHRQTHIQDPGWILIKAALFGVPKEAEAGHAGQLGDVF